ncbi:hypothetical protein JCM19046_126 [Bacillus sp. JCM 19046]|nr:hypothetical protein JCM19046_126 [Bacillus sp. JCM 19046]
MKRADDILGKKLIIPLIFLIAVGAAAYIFISRDQTPEYIEIPYVHITFEGDGENLENRLQMDYLDRQMGHTIQHWNIRLATNSNRSSEIYISYYTVDDLEADSEELMNILQSELESVEWTYDIVEEE